MGKTRVIMAALVAVVGLGLTACKPAPVADTGPPAWAYPLAPKGPPAKPSDAPFTVPDSALSLTKAQINLFNPPDWHPEDHPAMPEVVAKGRRPDVNACGYCHLPSGQGRPENAKLAGLPPAYFLRQMADFKSGARVSSVAHRGPLGGMVANAKAIHDDEAAQAAAYFASVAPRPSVKVIEAAMAPRTVDKGWILVLAPEGGTEPIGNRIIETPQSLELFEKRDGRSVILAYVPPGSLKKGRAIAAGRSGKPKLACVACHGEGLNGAGEIPGLAGRSPTYIVRQLYDFRTGGRHGEMAAAMQTVAKGLTPEEIVEVAAYLASAPPAKVAGG
jgi:cytochrome c553